MLNLNSIMLGSKQVKVMADFYKEVFGRPADMEEGGFFGWNGGGTFLSVGEHSEVKDTAQEPQRSIFNFETNEVKEEFERISKINGAKVITAPYEISGAWIATLADPDGNYFQLVTPWESNKNAI